jgi:hypothetical protein
MGTIAELRPAATAWIEVLAGKLRAGFVLIVDFGFSREQILAPHRTEGTLACYREHRRDGRPLEDPGEKDITAHVDFTALAASALEAGFELEGYTDQYHYLVAASQDLFEARRAWRFRIASNLGPSSIQSMGTQFRYGTLEGVEASRLSGNSRDPLEQLFQAAPEPSRTPGLSQT